jgi:hypothetical protein
MIIDLFFSKYLPEHVNSSQIHDKSSTKNYICVILHLLEIKVLQNSTSAFFKAFNINNYLYVLQYVL